MNVPASLRSDQVAVMPWIGWQLCTGLDGRNGVDQVAGITGMRKGRDSLEKLGKIGRYSPEIIADALVSLMEEKNGKTNNHKNT